MIDWYLSVRRLLRDIEQKSRDALAQYKQGGKDASAQVNAYIKSDYEKLKTLWAQQFPNGVPSNLGRHIGFGMDGDYEDILKADLAEVEAKAEEALRASAKKQVAAACAQAFGIWYANAREIMKGRAALSQPVQQQL